MYTCTEQLPVERDTLSCIWEQIACNYSMPVFSLISVMVYTFNTWVRSLTILQLGQSKMFNPDIHAQYTCKTNTLFILIVVISVNEAILVPWTDTWILQVPKIHCEGTNIPDIIWSWITHQTVCTTFFIKLWQNNLSFCY